MSNDKLLTEAAKNHTDALVEYFSMKLHVEAWKRDYGSSPSGDENELLTLREKLYQTENKLEEVALMVAMAGY